MADRAAVKLPEVAGVSHRQVQAGEVRLHVAEAGEGPPLVLLHGWPQHWWCWRHLIPPLSEDHRVLAPDLRGLGSSDAPPGDYRKATLADDVLALLDAEGIERVRLVGHDWGGFAAFLLALEHPERIEGLVALDIQPPWMRPERPRPRHLGLSLLLSYQLLLATPVVGPRALTDTTRLVRAILSAGSGPQASWSEEEIEAYAGPLREPQRARASSALYRSFLTRELPDLIGRGDRSRELTVPSLLVMGGESPLQRILAPRPAPTLQVETIAGVGHFLPEEAPAQVLEMVRARFPGSPVR